MNLEHMELSSAWRYVYLDTATNETLIVDELLTMEQMQHGRLRYKHSYKWYESESAVNGAKVGENV